MPIAQIKCIFSCNSEDEHHPAANLLKEGKKWKCGEPGIDSAYVILQLEKPAKITGIDIGNEGSAFVSVWVGKSGWTEDRYKQLLLTTSFMLPAEARTMDNSNRVRCYSSDALDHDVSKDKWDMVKIVCTQAFNKKVKFGLAFVKIRTADESTTHKSPKLNTSCDEVLGLPKDNVFSQFKFREESPESDGESASLFKKWKNETKNKSTDEPVMSTAAAIREASSSVSALEKCGKINKMTPKRTLQTKNDDDTDDDKNKNETKIPNRNRNALMYDDEDDTTSKPKLEKIINEDKERIEKEKADYLASKKKKDTKPKATPKRDNKSEKNKEKLASSAEKFKKFLDPSMTDDDKQINVNDEQNSDEKNNKDRTRDEKEEVDHESKPNPSSSQASAVTLSQSSNFSQASNDTDCSNVVSNKRRSSIMDPAAESPIKRSRVLDNPDQDANDDDDEVPLNEILRGIVFVISGIQNPERAQLRDKALKMGAKYKPDWDSSCTHLICAFPNTPKYKQVQGKGKILKREWINDCFDKKKKLPWRQYTL